MKIEGVSAWRRANEASTSREPSKTNKTKTASKPRKASSASSSRTAHDARSAPALRTASKGAPSFSPLDPWTSRGAWRVRRAPEAAVDASGAVATTNLRVSVESKDAVNALAAALSLRTGRRWSQLGVAGALVAFASRDAEGFLAFAEAS